MAKSSIILFKVLRCLKEKDCTLKELNSLVKHPRENVSRAVGRGMKKGLIEAAAEKFTLTTSGRASIENNTLIPSISMDIHLAAINPTGVLGDTPTAKCTIVSYDAKAIMKNDRRLDLDDILNSEDTGASGNKTRITSSVARVIDEISDAIGRESGIEGTQTAENRAALIVQAPDALPGNDIFNRAALANRAFNVTIQFDGRKWFAERRGAIEVGQVEQAKVLKNSIESSLRAMPHDQLVKLAVDFAITQVTLWKGDVPKLQSSYRLFKTQEAVKDTAVRLYNKFFPKSKEKLGNKMLQEMERLHIINYDSMQIHFAVIDKERLNRYLEEGPSADSS